MKSFLCNVLSFFLIFIFCTINSFAENTEKTPKEDITVVTILRADKTGNKKNELDGSDMILLEGNVLISVKKEDATIEISAESVSFDREKDMLFAEGSVKMNQKNSSGTGENATANSLLFNTATLEGIFDGGRVVQTQTDSLNLPSGSTLVVSSKIFGRDDSNTITFKNGALTFCDAENPHWKIKASRIWLLPGDEFAFFNAVLFVGPMPVLYLPAFWYPKDELIFNPVFGFRQREGYFFQTTTYLFGRKPLSAYDVSSQYLDKDSKEENIDSSYYSFVKPNKLKDQERQGLMLHNLQSDYKGDTTNYVKFLADWYASLGLSIGIDGVLTPKNNYVSDFKFNTQLGFSNTIFEKNAYYTPYGLYTGATYSDSSNFLGTTLPFRYKANIDLSISKPITLKLTMPIYSDPYFNYDFGRRTETMDWIDYLLSNPNVDLLTADEKEAERSRTEINSFTWNLSGSYTFPKINFIDPYVSSISISSFSSSIIFSNLENTKIATSQKERGAWKDYTPERKFFYPSQITPIKFSSKISGTLISISSNSASKNSTSSTNSKKLEFPLKAPEDLNISKETENSKDEDSSEKIATKSTNIESVTTTSESEYSSAENSTDKTLVAEKDSSTETATNLATASQEETKPEDKVLPDSALPNLTFSVPQVQNITDITYALTYAISPTYTSEIAYSYKKLETPEDFDWNRMKSTMVTFKASTNLTSKLDIKGEFLSITDSFTFDPNFQKHPYLSKDVEYGGYTDANIASIKKADYSAQKLDLTNSNSIKLKPFHYTENFSETGLTWNTTIKMIQTKFIGDEDNPDWHYITADLTDEKCVSVHTLDLILAATQNDKTFGQKLVLTTRLPPQVDEYKGVLTFTFPYTNLSFETGIRQVSSTDKTWEKQPFKQALTLTSSDKKIKLTQAYNYELEKNHHDAFKLGLSAYDFNIDYVAKYTTGYDFDMEKGWIPRNHQEFLPYSLSLGYAQSTKNFRHWKNRIEFAPSVASSIVYDFLRPTSSYFKIAPAITLKINKFLDIKFTAVSRNDVIYRYVQDYFGAKTEISGEKNWLADLVDSFRFDDEEKRKSSGFKLESFNIKITHDLHDWDFSSIFEIKPRLVTKSDGQKYYDYSPYFTLSVVWRPMGGMKTKIVDKYGDWELNP